MLPLLCIFFYTFLKVKVKIMPTAVEHAACMASLSRLYNLLWRVISLMFDPPSPTILLCFHVPVWKHLPSHATSAHVNDIKIVIKNKQPWGRL